MKRQDDVRQRIEAACRSEPRIEMERYPMRVDLADDQTVVLDGEVGSLAAKRLAARLAGEAADGMRVEDHLRLAAGEAHSDGEILQGLAKVLSGQIDLQNCTLRQRKGERVETLREAAPAAQGEDANFYRSGEIEFMVADGEVCLDGRVISLSHKRLAEVLAWWVPGTRNVANRLAVEPAERDGDEEISDAVHLALEMDPLVHAEQISVSTADCVVTLQGAVFNPEERTMAEFDAWCVPGTADVVNRLQIVQPS